MNCALCGRSHRAEARFCDQCGNPLAGESARAPRAYTPPHLADRILTSRWALEGERKQVTVLFADLENSTALSSALGLEAWHRLLDAYFRILADGVHRFEGTINQFTGDGIMALFGAPVAHEDHAQRACHAALQLARALTEFADERLRRDKLRVRARIGLNTGLVVVGKIGDDLRMDYTAQGHTVALAARVQEIAEPGRVFLTEHVARRVEGFFALRDLGTSTLKGFPEPTRVYALDGLGALRTRLDLSRAYGFSTLVGRNAERALLEAKLERALGRDGQALGIVGDAGVGKSRLAFEFVARCRAEGIAVCEAHCPPHAATLPFFAIAELLRSDFGVASTDTPKAARTRIAKRLAKLSKTFEKSLPLVFETLSVADGSTSPPPQDDDTRRERLRLFLRHWVQAASASAPLVILLDDLHWIDAESAALLGDLVDGLAWTRTLLVASYRLEHSAVWLRGAHCAPIQLGPLEPDERRDLLRALLGEDASCVELAARIDARAGGNPFFAEEIVRDAAGAGRLIGQPGAYRVVQDAATALELPATVQAVLAGRIDRLDEREKRVLQTAAALGTRFDPQLLARVGGFSDDEVSDALATLVALEFAQPVPSGYAFRHPLTQEVAYHSQLESRRQHLHVEAARAIEAMHPDRLGEQAGLIAHHWAAAGSRWEAARWRQRAALRVSSIQVQRPRAPRQN
jgi:class 3 adenylate cyclase